LYGAYTPIDKDGFTLNLPYCNTDMMQLFFDQFSKIKPNELKITIMDNASFHHTKKLNIPVILFPYSFLHTVQNSILLKEFGNI